MSFPPPCAPATQERAVENTISSLHRIIDATQGENRQLRENIRRLQETQSRIVDVLERHASVIEVITGYSVASLRNMQKEISTDYQCYYSAIEMFQKYFVLVLSDCTGMKFKDWVDFQDYLLYEETTNPHERDIFKTAGTVLQVCDMDCNDVDQLKRFLLFFDAKNWKKVEVSIESALGRLETITFPCELDGIKEPMRKCLKAIPKLTTKHFEALKKKKHVFTD